jgi:hypothetical protein
MALLLFVTPVSAQSFRLALHVGANMNKMNGKSFSEEYQLGYHLGIAPEIMFAKKWGIQPELMFNQTNTQTSTQFKDIYNPTMEELKNVKLNYLSIPLLLTYRPAKILSFQAGPQFGILMSQDKTLLQNGGDAFKNGDFSMVAGAQVYILGFRAYGRYAIGLANLNDIDNQDKWKSQAFQIGVGFTL